MIPDDVREALADARIDVELVTESRSPVVWRARFRSGRSTVVVDKMIAHGDGTPGGEWQMPITAGSSADPAITGLHLPDVSVGAVRIFHGLPAGRFLGEILVEPVATPQTRGLDVLGAGLAALHGSASPDWPVAARGVVPLVALCRALTSGAELPWVDAATAARIRAIVEEADDLLGALDVVATMKGGCPLHGSASLGQVWHGDDGTDQLLGWWQPCRGPAAIDVGVAMGDLVEIGLAHAALGDDDAARAGLGGADALLRAYRGAQPAAAPASPGASIAAVAAARIIEHMVQNQAFAGTDIRRMNWAVKLARTALSIIS